MWVASELEELSVWADDLQQRGDPWGELVTTSLAAASAEIPEHREQLQRRVAELEREVLQPRVQPLIEGFGGIRPIWEHGAMVGLRVLDPIRRTGEARLERMTELLRLPAARFLWFLRVDLPAHDWRRLHVEVPRLLLDPEIVARPRFLMLGEPPTGVPSRLTHGMIDPRGPFGQAGRRIADPERGLLGFIYEGCRVELPWKTEKGSRGHAFARIAKRIRADPSRLSNEDRVVLARALDDRSSRVRTAAMRCLAELGVAAAPLLPDLALAHSEQESRNQWHTTMATLLGQPEVVACVAANSVLEQFPIVRHLPDALDPHAIARIKAMIQERDAVPYTWDADLRRARDRWDPAPPPTKSWLARLRSWWAR